MQKKATRMFEQAGIALDKVRFYQFDYADVWFRDYGPIFIVNDHKELCHGVLGLQYLGGKYEELMKDGQVPQVINQDMRLRCFKPGIVMEGGQ